MSPLNDRWFELYISSLFSFVFLRPPQNALPSGCEPNESLGPPAPPPQNALPSVCEPSESLGPPPRHFKVTIAISILTTNLTLNSSK